MTEILGKSIDSETGEVDLFVCTSNWESIKVTRSEIVNNIDEKIQSALADMKSKLSAMACTGCGGNIDPQTLLCTCCGRQYRLVAKDDR